MLRDRKTLAAIGGLLHSADVVPFSFRFHGAWQAFPRLAAAFFFVLIGPGYLMKVRQPVCEVPSGPGKAMTRSGLMDFPSAAHSSTGKASRRRALIASA
jgi:hypothetical protein